jgi:streptogramin lyase
MKTFDCPKCGAPVTCDPNLSTGTAVCAYCQSQLALPEGDRPARVLPRIDINIGPQAAATASKALWIGALVPIVIVVLVLGVVLAVTFGIRSAIKSAIAPITKRSTNTGTSSGPRAGEPANAFAKQVQTFGSEGIAPGMITDARTIAVDGKGQIYVGERSGGRIQVFDPTGKFVSQWFADQKMPLLALAVDRKGTVYLAQGGFINRYEGDTGKSLGQLSYSQRGFDDVTIAPDQGLVCALYYGRDDIVRFDSSGKVVRTIPAAISTAADRSELNTRVAVDGRGNIYALGGFTNSVFKFSPEGKFLNRFGPPGRQPGQISGAMAIAVDNQGRVFVSDTKGVQIFDSDGRYVNVFKPDGIASGMVFNDQNELLIVSRSKVMKFVLNQ